MLVAAWAVLALLQDRVPDLLWHPARVAHVVADHPHLDHLAVAGACADWIVYQSSGRVRDGVTALRTFMERASRDLAADADVDTTSPLGAYDRFIN